MLFFHCESNCLNCFSRSNKRPNSLPHSSQKIQTWKIPEERQQAWDLFLRAETWVRAITTVQPQQLKIIWAAALVSFSFWSTALFAPASQERRPLTHQQQFEIYTGQGNHCCSLGTYSMVKTSIVCSLCTRCWCYKRLVAGRKIREDKLSPSTGTGPTVNKGI